jgi:hypothetical protein
MPQHDEDNSARQPHQSQQNQTSVEKSISFPQRGSPGRVSKAETLSLVKMLKRGLLVASVLGFGAMGGLVMSHTVGTTNQAAGSPPVQTGSPPTSPSLFTPFDREDHEEDHDEDEEGFFQQQGGYNIGANRSTQPPATTSRTS